MIYYTPFHSIMSYSIIFWGNSTHSQKIFELQKRAIRTITGSRNKDSCRNLFKQLGVVPLQSQYIFFYSFIRGEEQEILQQIMTVTIYQLDKVKNFHLPSASLSIRLQSVLYSGVQLFSRLKTDCRISQ